MDTKYIEKAIDKYNKDIQRNGKSIQNLQIEKKDLLEKITELEVRINQIDSNCESFILKSERAQGAVQALSALINKI